uniref:Uncharacterized protein n=1 Tax=Arundo donax TaxID=35708 RepID=A0A0A9ERZ3_ARUDO
MVLPAHYSVSAIKTSVENSAFVLFSINEAVKLTVCG